MKKVLAAVPLLLLGVLAGVIATRPDRFVVVRGHPIPEIPQAFVHETLVSLHTWPGWSHWGQTDRVPGSDRFEGPPAGVGSRWSWERKREGDRMGLELIRETPDTVVFRITGTSPAQPTLKFSIAPGMVAAEFEGRLELAGKLVSIVKPPEKVIAPSLERELKLLAKQVGAPSLSVPP